MDRIRKTKLMLRCSEAARLLHELADEFGPDRPMAASRIAQAAGDLQEEGDSLASEIGLDLWERGTSGP